MPSRDPLTGKRLSGAAQRARARAAGRTQAKGSRGRPVVKPWMFVDSEGANDPAGEFGGVPGRQWTHLLCAASDDGTNRQLCSDTPLGTDDMLSFIVGLPARYKLGGYFFGYDRDQILHGVNPESLKRLYGVGQPPKPIRHNEYILHAFHTTLTVCRPHAQLDSDPDELTGIPGPRRIIWDVGRFYQMSFARAVEAWGIATDGEREFLERMKAARSSFDLDYWRSHADEIVQYSLLENRLAARLQTTFDWKVRELGYPLKQWYGAGSVAKVMLTKHGVKAHLKNRRRHTSARLIELLPHAYYGGRFEISAPGIYKPVYEYDLRSAYPASYRDLPCLIHGHWRRERGSAVNIGEIGQHDLCVVESNTRERDRFAPFPLRLNTGAICYPCQRSGHVVWGRELIAALTMWPRLKRATGKPGIWIGERWRYAADCNCRPFEWIGEVYEQRLALGKDTAGYPLKLGLNAIYGTLASVLGAKYEDKQLTGWCDPIWSSMITAYTRARLLEAIHLAGGAAAPGPFMFATDAIYSTTPIDLGGEGLGDWEGHTFAEGGLVIQPGIYHLKGQSVASKLRGRGLSAKDLDGRVPAFYHAYKNEGDRATVTLQLAPRYQSVRLCLHRGNTEKAWRWIAERRQLSFDPAGKREHRSGQWLPRSRHDIPPFGLPGGGDEPHGPFLGLLAGRVGLPGVSEQQRLQQIAEGDQPMGPYAW